MPAQNHFLFSKIKEHRGGIVAMEAQQRRVQCGRKENRAERRQMGGLLRGVEVFMLRIALSHHLAKGAD